LKTTICGSFKFLKEIDEAIRECQGYGIEVLSPRGTKIIGENEEFLLLEGDRNTAIKRVEDRHLRCIKESDFVLLICPNGYFGVSCAFEIGAALASRVPVFVMNAPSRLLDGDGPISFCDNVEVVSGIPMILERLSEITEASTVVL